MPIRMRAAGPLLVRASTAPLDMPVPSTLDLDSLDLASITAWLGKTWSQPGVREAVTIASPLLSRRLDISVASGHQDGRRALRLARSLATYLLRWQRRATPFGLFAGVTTASVGPRLGGTVTRAQAVARPDAGWLHLLADQIEASPKLRQGLRVVANNLATERDGRLHLSMRGEVGAPLPERTRDVSVRLTRPVRAALAAARAPVRLNELAARLTTASGASPATAHRMLNTLLAQGFLLSDLRPATTSTDPLGSVIDALVAADVPHTDASPLPILEEIEALLRQHDRAVEPSDAATLRALAAERMASLVPAAPRTTAVDVRLDGNLVVPQQVIEEAESTAAVLLRLTTEPFGAVRWLDYHARFRARYGAGVLVPIRELLSDSGLGYPTGFLDAQPTRPAWRGITDRDAVLLNLLHRAALDGAGEVVLSDADIDALTTGDHDTVIPPARCELGFTIHATSREAIDSGDFLLRVTAAPEACTSLTGRFAHLLDQAETEDLVGYLTSGGRWNDQPVVAQLAHPARSPDADNVVRVPALAGQLIALAEHHPGPHIDVDDLAVTADDTQMYLVQISTGRRVVPVIPHALQLGLHTPPLARFLAEVADARSAVYRPFDFGAARTLDHTPRIRYRRTILAPARWILHTDQLIKQPGATWAQRLHSWRTSRHVPAQVALATSGEHLPLDLDQPLDMSVLRHLIARAKRVELREYLPGGDTWLGRPAELLVPMVVVDPPARPLPALAAPEPSTPPAADGVLALRLTGNPARFDEIVADHLPRLAATLDPMGLRWWWMRRLADLIVPERDQILAITLHFVHIEEARAAMAQVAGFVRDLGDRQLPSELSIHTHHDHPGRYGTGPALDAARDVFTTDTLAGIAQTRLARTTGIPAQALAAASMVTVAAALADSPAGGYRNLLIAVPYTPARLDRAATEQACTFSDPAAGYKELRAVGGGEVADAWTARNAAVAAYRDTLAGQRDPSSTLSALLRDHHTRTLGVNRETEHVTRQMARRTAQRRLALRESR